MFKNFQKYRDLSSTKRRYLSLKQIKQLYCTLICPYINYAIISWGNASMSNLKKIQVKQNNIVRLIFFATLYGKHTESALPFLNPLDLLSVENIFYQHFCYACDVHSYNKRYASKTNFKKNILGLMLGNEPHRLWLFNKLWQELPIELKHVKHFSFRKKVKQYLLIKQIHCQS